jgi:hypothetical protein
MRGWLMLAAAVVAASVTQGEPAAARGERLVYEIVVSDPGTRSQGWQGTLYDEADRPVVVAPGDRFENRLGVFESVACAQAWSACGMIHADMLAWMKTHEHNVIMGPEPTVYRLFVLHEGTRSEGYEGRLFVNDAEITPCAPPRATPMGTFVCKGRTHLWDRAGWYHEAWPEARVAAGK